MDLFEAFSGFALIAALPVLVVMLKLIGPRSGDADSLFRSPTDLGWPRGVQEEEPVRWRVELLGRNRSIDAFPDAANRPVHATRLNAG